MGTTFCTGKLFEKGLRIGTGQCNVKVRAPASSLLDVNQLVPSVVPPFCVAS